MTASFIVVSPSKIDKVGANKIEIYGSKDSSNTWKVVDTTIGTIENGPLKENALNHTSSVKYSGTVGYLYKAKIYFYAENAKGYGQTSQMSGAITSE